MSNFPARYRFPLLAEQLADLERAVREFVLPGCCPEQPFVSRSTVTLTTGSCFAEEVQNAIKRQGLDAVFLNTGADNYMSPVSTLAMLEMGVEVEVTESVSRAGLAVITIGQAMTAFRDGAALPAIKARELNDVDWRLLTVEEAAYATRGIVKAVQAKSPGCHVVLTLSPIPLKMSVNHPSVFFQDCLSKSILRVGIDQAMGEPNVSYWPSFEIIRWLGGHVGPLFGEGDNRHPLKSAVDLITRLFIEKYFLPA